MKPHMYLLNKDWEPTIVYPEEMKEGLPDNTTGDTGNTEPGHQRDRFDQQTGGRHALGATGHRR